MESPLGSALANISAGFDEERFFCSSARCVYFRNVDDTSTIFETGA